MILEILLLEKTIGLVEKNVGSKDQTTLRSFRTEPEASSGNPWLLLRQKLLNFPRPKGVCFSALARIACTWFCQTFNSLDSAFHVETEAWCSVCYIEWHWIHGEKKLENESWLKYSFKKAILWHQDARIKIILKGQQLQPFFSRFIRCLKATMIILFIVLNPHCFYRICVIIYVGYAYAINDISNLTIIPNIKVLKQKKPELSIA